MAYNLAFSIKRLNPNARISLWVDGGIAHHIQDPSVFDHVDHLTRDQFTDERGGVDPAKVKTIVYKLGRKYFDRFMYLDVDAICMNDPLPMFESMNGLVVSTDVLGRGGRNDAIGYSLWATNENIWKTFGLDESATVCGIQSSWMYFEASQTCDIMQDYIDHFMSVGIPRHVLSQAWGGTLPDELVYQGVFAKMGLIPDHPDEIRPLLFGTPHVTITEDEAREHYSFLSIYGTGRDGTTTQKKWLRLYDAIVREMKAPYLYLQSELMKDKHLNAK
jgi:hypothetical protein